MLNMPRLKQIRKFLTQEAACVIEQGLIISHLDYCNSIYAGLPASTIAPLVQVQAMCTNLILGVSKYHSTSECLQTLHWFPICERVDLKILRTTYKCTLGEAPMYLHHHLVNATPRWGGLHSGSTMHNLVVPCIQTDRLLDHLLFTVQVYGTLSLMTLINHQLQNCLKAESKHYYTNEFLISSHFQKHFYN